MLCNVLGCCNAYQAAIGLHYIIVSELISDYVVFFILQNRFQINYVIILASMVKRRTLAYKSSQFQVKAALLLPLPLSLLRPLSTTLSLYLPTTLSCYLSLSYYLSLLLSLSLLLALSLSPTTLAIWPYDLRVLQGAARRGAQFYLRFSGSPDTFFWCSEMSLFSLKICTPVKATP